MYLRRLDISGFKSFAQHTTLEFDRGVTAIVGPNGSGKSNVADAIRWVLGEHSKKMLRSKKSEDVIFAGSATKPRSPRAEVVLHLDNRDNKLPVDFPEVEISRKILRDGTNEYSLNNQSVRLLDVNELLAAGGFANRSYGIVSQGMADAILTASLTERRSMFEEAAGVKQYQLKKDRSLNKLEQTKHNLTRVFDLLREIAPRLRSLERQAKRAEERGKIEKNLKTLQQKWYQHFWHSIAEKIEKTSKLISNDKTAAKELEETSSRLKKELKSLSSESTEADLAYQNTLDGLDKKRRERLQLQEELALTTGRLRAKNELGEGAASTGRAAELESIRENAARLKKEVASLAEKLKLQKEGTQDLEKKLVETESEYQKTQKVISGGEGPVSADELTIELEEILHLQEEFIASLSGTQDLDELQDLSRQAQEIESQIQSVLDELRQADKKQSISDKEPKKALLNLIKERDTLSTKLRDEKVTEAGLSSRRDVLEEQLSQLNERTRTLEAATGIKDGSSPSNDPLKAKQAKLEQEKKKLDEEISKSEEELKDLRQKEQSARSKIGGKEKELFKSQHELTRQKEKQSSLEIEMARCETRKEDLVSEIEEDLGHEAFIKISQSSLEKLEDPAETKKRIDSLKARVDIIGTTDPLLLKEYEETKERYEFLSKQKTDLVEASQKLRKVITKLERIIKTRFHKSFQQITKDFDRYFKILFGGGRASLHLQRLVKTAQPVEEDEENHEPAQKPKEELGVAIKASPPGKKLASINMLSGGERALTSVAILFAIIANNPPPFCVLDEVDAALDEANSRRFGKILADLSKRTQFITITHNRETMQQASVLYGVTMQADGISKLLSVKLDDSPEKE